MFLDLSTYSEDNGFSEDIVLDLLVLFLEEIRIQKDFFEANIYSEKLFFESVHRLKGTVTQFGCSGLVQKCKEIELMDFHQASERGRLVELLLRDIDQLMDETHSLIDSREKNCA